MDSVVVIPVFNQCNYTAQCLSSFNSVGVSDSDIIVVDNGSTDGTREFLTARPGLRVIRNESNLGCSYAWNQGAKASEATWTIISNNDVVVAPGFIRGLIGFAEESGCAIVSPARCDGELDYDFPAFSEQYVRAMSPASRNPCASGVCFMVHRRVFSAIGYFDERIGKAGYEDEDFFRRARKAGFRLAISGRAFLHHFGSVTQKSVKGSLGAGETRLSNRAYFRQKHGLTWMKRMFESRQDRLRAALWRWTERRRFGYTLCMQRVGGVWRFR